MRPSVSGVNTYLERNTYSVVERWTTVVAERSQASFAVARLQTSVGFELPRHSAGLEGAQNLSGVGQDRMLPGDKQGQIPFGVWGA